MYDVVASGITADNRVNVILEKQDGSRTPYWYHTTFYNVNDALEYLKDLYRDGVSKSDIEDRLWLTLKELQEQ